MRLILEETAESAKSAELAAKIAAARELAAEQLATDQRPLLLNLADSLEAATPAAFLRPLAPRELATRLLELFRFLFREEAAGPVRLLPGAGDMTLLVIGTPDAPYLLHTVQTLLIRQGVVFQVVCHPLLKVRREQGRLVELGAKKGECEALIVVLLHGLPEEARPALLGAVEAGLEAVLQVRVGRGAIDAALAGLEQGAQGAEQDFLRWLREGNFLPFAYRRLRLEEDGDKVREEPGSSCGLAALPPDEDDRQRLLREQRIVVEITNQPSPILRDERLTYVGIRERRGEEPFEHAFLGLFSESSRNAPCTAIPALRRRIEAALERLAIPREGHDGRKAIDIVNTFPKAELFFLTDAELDATLRSFAQIYRHGIVKAMVTRSLSVHGLTLLLIMPREFYTPDNVARIESYLSRVLRADDLVSRVVHISTDYLSLHVSARPHAELLHLDQGRIERGLTRLVRPWEQRLRRQFVRAYGQAEALRRWQRYGSAFSREYKALTHPRFAMRDLRVVERLLEEGSDQVDLWGPFADPGGDFFRLQFYSLSEKYLNDLMPILENLSLSVIDEVDFSLELAPRPVFIKSFAVRGADPARPNLAALRRPLLEAFLAIHRGLAENDYLHRLLIPTGLDWRQIDIFRGYRNYYFQLGSPFTKKRVAFALINNPRVARLLYDYFAARFHPDPRWEDPVRREEEGLSPLRQQLAATLEAVADTNEDRILRTLFNLIDSTVRTNFFLRQEREDYFFAFKISALGIIEMPAPRPLYEIYVHSATMEGIHLRGGKVARGGIRWSDRPDDFRTEILGLMKTQMSKNALIVPVGSKGGFVVKTSFATREEGARLSREAYQLLMRGLLDLTDNRVGEQIVPPEQVVAYDEPDPYLVVAADKGTAQFSDTANAISREYGFWLDDAFASGGSHGYDHKALGVTARGAWECVRRHFRELGTDIQKEPFTVVGIGDMSGDVFGNGMLLSPQIRLLAAFDHRHVFLDPDPDPETSFAERQRLFALPRSSWDDYDRKLISAGGGIFPRDAKEIPLSPEVQHWLGIRHETLDVPGLIRLLLCAEVDLLWNGGIGTYVKAAGEKHEDVGDRANDPLRVDATQLRARVVGEGGNLGFTQRGRIEYALGGGRINTDAVDNSGGVDCSDHEVNLKILMQGLLAAGRLPSEEERNRELEEVTDEVVTAVLANNDQQSLCISLDQQRCALDSESFFALTDRLTRAGLLDRRGEFLPTAKEVLAREAGVLTRPELAILMAYSKMQLYQALLESDLPDREALRPRLESYFPEAVVSRYQAELPRHPLAREIVATVLTNDIVGHSGAAFLNHLVTRTGAGLATAAEAYLVFEAALGAEELRRAISTLEREMPGAGLYRHLFDIEASLAAMCEWALERGRSVVAEADTVRRYREQAEQYRKALGSLLGEEEWRACQQAAAELEDSGLPEETAQHLAALAHFDSFLPLVELQERTGGDFFSVAQTFNEVRARLGVAALLAALGAVPLRDRWDRLAHQALASAFNRGAFRLTAAVLAESAGNPDAFFAHRRSALRTYQGLREALRGSLPANFHPFTVLVRALEALAEEHPAQEKMQ